MTISFFLIQLVGIVGTALYLLSFQFRNNRKLFMLQLLAYVFYFTHYYLLGALTASFSIVVNLFRSLLLSSSYKWAHSRYACGVLCVLQIAVAKFTWVGWISLLPVIANIGSTVGGYTNNPQKIRIANMFINSPLFIVYAVLVGSWAGIIDEISSEASIILSIIRYGWKGLDEQQE